MENSLTGIVCFELFVELMTQRPICRRWVIGSEDSLGVMVHSPGRLGTKDPAID